MTDSPDRDELLRRLRDVRARPGGILGDLLNNLRATPRAPSLDEADDGSQRRRELLAEAAQLVLGERSSVTPYPDDLLEHIHRATSRTDGVLGDLVQRIHQPADPYDVTDPVERRLARLREVFVKACEEFARKHRSLVYPAIAAGLWRLRRAAWRARERADVGVAALAGVAVAAANTLTAAALIAGMALGASPSSMPATSSMHRLSTDRHNVAHSTTSTRAQRAHEAHAAKLAIRIDVSSGSGASTSASARRDRHRLVIDDSVNGWLEPVPSYPVQISGTLLWVNCEESTTGRTVCAAAEPILGMVPPPPYGHHS